MPLSNRYLEDVVFQHPINKVPVMEDGYNTGEYVVTYGDTITVKAFVSADAERSQLEHFGASMPFEKTCMTNDKACGISVCDIVTYGGEKWLVKKIIKAKCLSYIAWGMDRVDINAENDLDTSDGSPLLAKLNPSDLLVQLESFNGWQ